MSNSGQQAIPTPPSVSSGIGDYVSNYPRLVEMMEKYGGRELQAQRAAQAQVYPELEQMKNTLMGQVQRGIGEEAPDWYANQMSDVLGSKFGRNAVFNPLGQQAYASEYQAGMKGWQDYWRNLAASFSGSQPVYQATNPASQFTPGQVLSNNMQGYSSYLPAWSQQSQQNWATPFMYMQGAGNVLSGLGSFMPMGGGGSTSSVMANLPAGGQSVWRRS
jgi:hypothetical protein